MRARPRTWPSMRLSRLRTAALLSFCHAVYIPPRGILGKAAAGGISAHHHHHHKVRSGVTDPVCGMTVDPHTAKHRAEHRGHTYYFCSAGCRTKFVDDPQKYLEADAHPNPWPKAQSTPARCIRRSGRSAPAPARSAAWRSSRKSPPPRPALIPNSST